MKQRIAFGAQPERRDTLNREAATAGRQNGNIFGGQTLQNLLESISFFHEAPSILRLFTRRQRATLPMARRRRSHDERERSSSTASTAPRGFGGWRHGMHTAARRCLTRK